MESGLTPVSFTQFANSAGSTSRTALMSPSDTSRDSSAAGDPDFVRNRKLSQEMRRQQEPAPVVSSSTAPSPTPPSFVTASIPSGVASSSTSGPDTDTAPSVPSDVPRALPLRAPSMLSGTASIIGSSRYGEAPPQYSA
ncbi:hypothetical protein K438DRAFT_1856495 [Mycena galopus ATCC 62051]|nr:hypothetical protein K438DRAFT_1856495 [Mycena galopus ATCC 62051]